MSKQKFFHVNQSPAAYLAFAGEIACMAVAASYSWVAAIAVFVAICIQAGWQVYLEEQIKEDHP